VRGLRYLIALLAAGCTLETPEPGEAAAVAQLPGPLRRLILNEGHPSALPVDFDHALHAGGATGSSCASCHHELRLRPAAVPAACTTCHVATYLAPKVDESQPHRHGLPPDL